MRHHVITCFDEFIPAGQTVYTSAEFNSRLGAMDQFSIQSILDNLALGTTPTFNLWIEHSNDGRTWLQRKDQTSAGAATGEISIDLTGLTTASRAYADGTVGATAASTPWSCSSAPLLAFVRFKMTLSSGTAGHVKVHVAMRGAR